jgi:hypothetical protein
MQSETLSNLHLGWIFGGWFVAVSVTAAVYVGTVGLGLVTTGATVVVWVGVSLTVGFFAGGLLVGMRWSNAPILHGAAITLFAVVVWFVLALFGGSENVDSPSVVLGAILVQLVASTTGGWMGKRFAQLR